MLSTCKDLLLYRDWRDIPDLLRVSGLPSAILVFEKFASHLQWLANGWDDALVSSVVADVQLYHQNPCMYKKAAFEWLSTVVTTMRERVKTKPS